MVPLQWDHSQDEEQWEMKDGQHLHTQPDRQTDKQTQSIPVGKTVSSLLETFINISYTQL